MQTGKIVIRSDFCGFSHNVVLKPTCIVTGTSRVSTATSSPSHTTGLVCGPYFKHR